MSSKSIIFSLLITVFSFCTNYAQSKKVSIDYRMSINQGMQKELSANLEFDKGISVFRWNNTDNHTKTSEDDFGNTKFYIDVTDSIGTINMINYNVDSIFTRTLRFKNAIILKEKKPEIDWKIHEETKKIGDFKVQKATTTFRGRSYEAWFASEIPVKIGPWKLNGLPGLIMEAYDSDGIVRFNFRKMTTSESDLTLSNKIFKSGQVVGVEEYKELQNSLAEDMVKKIMAKMPRGTSISIDEKTETFLEKEYN
ncbi:GLPGLI family protein [Christiangramia echinicola]|uniref:GLPGLI family protein n=1 Tax=Christiangramia echinicola TaxID=279359 RepID=A0A1H1LDK0_9FLAO|nr:GLPGLI family protein [Christiangramia echinicola]SDR72402.1 GLPGLI family protein [Christiangramia echinicola]